MLASMGRSPRTTGGHRMRKGPVPRGGWPSAFRGSDALRESAAGEGAETWVHDPRTCFGVERLKKESGTQGSGVPLAGAFHRDYPMSWYAGALFKLLMKEYSFIKTAQFDGTPLQMSSNRLQASSYCNMAWFPGGPRRRFRMQAFKKFLPT